MASFGPRFTSVVLILAMMSGVGGAAPAQRKAVFLSSPAYTLDLSLTMTGRCAPVEGSDFRHLDLYAGFSGLRFLSPSTKDVPVTIQRGSGLASDEVEGRGEIRGFDLCPAWEDETHAIPAKVTKGPSPFRATLTVLTQEEAIERRGYPRDEAIPIVTARPAVWLEFSTKFSILGQELAWEHPGLSKSGISDYSFVFDLPLDALGKGQPYSFEFPHSDEGERGTWSVMLTPASAR